MHSVSLPSFHHSTNSKSSWSGRNVPNAAGNLAELHNMGINEPNEVLLKMLSEVSSVIEIVQLVCVCVL